MHSSETLAETSRHVVVPVKGIDDVPGPPDNILEDILTQKQALQAAGRHISCA